jgi:hypothetical protein
LALFCIKFSYESFVSSIAIKNAMLPESDLRPIRSNVLPDQEPQSCRRTKQRIPSLLPAGRQAIRFNFQLALSPAVFYNQDS